ncbi:hypothetical protein ACQ4PT_012928 [Festuca glaucescens]
MSWMTASAGGSAGNGGASARATRAAAISARAFASSVLDSASSAWSFALASAISALPANRSTVDDRGGQADWKNLELRIMSLKRSMNLVVLNYESHVYSLRRLNADQFFYPTAAEAAAHRKDLPIENKQVREP